MTIYERKVIMNIGDTVEYYNVYDEKKSGVITEVFLTWTATRI